MFEVMKSKQQKQKIIIDSSVVATPDMKLDTNKTLTYIQEEPQVTTKG